MRLVTGINLNARCRAEVLSAYGYRWTVENERRAREWYRTGGHEPPTCELVTDARWLQDHAFYVVPDRLSLNRRHAEPAYLAS